MRNKKFWRIVSVSLCVLCVIFIFSNSLDNGAESSFKSGLVVAVLQGIADFFADGVTVSENFVRTMGHFCEFALLGFLLVFCVKTFTKEYFKNIFIVFFTSLAVAVADEILQLFSPGRASDVLDVAVDFSGAVAGVLFFVLSLKIIQVFLTVRRRKKDAGKA